MKKSVRRVDCDRAVNGWRFLSSLLLMLMIDFGSPRMRDLNSVIQGDFCAPIRSDSDLRPPIHTDFDSPICGDLGSPIHRTIGILMVKVVPSPSPELG